MSLSHGDKTGIGYLKKIVNEFNCYCYNIIKKEFPLIKNNELDRWFEKRFISEIAQIKFNCGLEIEYYKYNEIYELLNKKIIIYGAGKVGKDYYAQFSKQENCNVVSWTDKNYDKYNYPYYRVKSLDETFAKDYDIVVIAVLKEQTAQSIRDELIARGIPKEKIIWKEPSKITDSINLL
jgi:lactate dehydrogenase-like 2-hydroxyacid dehydrogenase